MFRLFSSWTLVVSRRCVERCILLFALGLVGAAACSHPLVGPMDDGATLVPTRQVIRPAGKTVEFAGRPVDLVPSPDGRHVYVKDHRGLVVLDAASNEVMQELPFGEGTGASMHGVLLSADGRKIYATTAHTLLFEGGIDDAGVVTWLRKIRLPGPKGKGNSDAMGLALSPDGSTLYVCLSRNNTVGVVDLQAGKLVKEIPVGAAPYDCEITNDGRTLYVSDWGGRHPKAGERARPSSGTQVLVDERGVASSGAVSVVDLGRDLETAVIETGLHPSDLVLSSDEQRLYVANANSDTIEIIDAVRGRVLQSLSVRPLPDLPFGSLPNALALDEGADRLYVANGGNNAVAVVALGERAEVAGFIPVGWFPGALALSGGRLFVANVKGVGSRTNPNKKEGWSVYWHRGSVTRLNPPDREALARMRPDVLAQNRLRLSKSGNRPGRADVCPKPVPEHFGEPSVFQHVVYIIKENRTYDQVFGDMERANSDPNLCIFPREVTPNHHALADEFVLLDNYYCNGVNSADGHSWSTEGIVTDHLEKSFGGFTRSYTFGDDPLTYSSGGFIWDRVLAAGLSFRNYGEFDSATPHGGNFSFRDIYDDFISGRRSIRFDQSIGVDRVRRLSCKDYPGWNLNIPDVLRADVFLKELKAFSRRNEFPNFTIVYLPQDHTSGTSPGHPTPRAQVADNDLALGRIVDGLTHSPFWSSTCIFVIEDDPQNGFDHVDGHRSLCLVISPYTRRGEVISTFYNQTGVLHTMTRILGVPPLTQLDAMAPVMCDCFRTVPDFSPYDVRPNLIPLTEMNPPKTALRGRALHWARASEAQPFERTDEANEDTLNRILWHAMKGVATPYPASFAGAHGHGLAALGLVLGESDD